MAKDIEYSEKYCDEHFEYRHVILPKILKSEVPRNRLMEEQEWRAIGVTQSRGWMHYMIHHPEPHILLFRRPVRTDPRTGKAPLNWNIPDDLSDKEKAYWLNDIHIQKLKQKSQNKSKNYRHHSHHTRNNSQNKENQENNSENTYYPNERR
eukprot:203909_1